MVNVQEKPPPEIPPPPPEIIEELPSGRYRSVTHCSKSEIDPERYDEAIEIIKAQFEAIEGVTVESAEIIQVSAPESIEPNYVWTDYVDTLEVIEYDHTDIIVVFRVSSPVPVWLIALAIGTIIGILIGLLISGVLEPIAKFIYEHPEIVGLALIIILIILALIMLKPKR